MSGASMAAGRRPDLVGIGEILMDMTPAEGPRGPCFQANPGGAPCNFLAMAARMGSSVAFIGKVGDDAFGRRLRAALEEAGVDATGLLVDPEAATTLAFVHLAPSGDRSFSFYRRGCADTMLRPGELDPGVLDGCRALYCGSLAFSDEPLRSAADLLLSRARERGLIVFHDSNYRPALWSSPRTALETMRALVARADVLKVSDDEALMLTGEAEPGQAARALAAMGPSLVCVTRGAAESILAFKGRCIEVPTPGVPVVDTTGAGDAFFGTLAHLLLSALDPALQARSADALACLSPDEVLDMVRVAHAAAGLCVQGYGAIPSLPTREAVLAAAGRG